MKSINKLLLLFLLPLACVAQPQNTGGIRESIVAGNDAWVAAMEAGNAEAAAALYTESAKIMPPGRDAAVGRSDIQAVWQGAIDNGVKQAELKTDEVQQYNDTVIEVGRYILSGSEEEVLDQGKYMVIWKQVDDQWMLHRGIWNTSLPQEQTAAQEQ